MAQAAESPRRTSVESTLQRLERLGGVMAAGRTSDESLAAEAAASASPVPDSAADAAPSKAAANTSSSASPVQPVGGLTLFL